jgi:hypothetical protein
VLVIIPDGTRNAPIPLMFRLLYEQLGERVTRLDYLIALGTHPPMSEAAIDKLVAISVPERAARYPNVRIFNHAWNRADALQTLGFIPASEVEQLTQGLLNQEIEVALDRSILDYDHLVICGPVFPHEVVGFSGGAKYLFPGIAGPDIINASHWYPRRCARAHDRSTRRREGISGRLSGGRAADDHFSGPGGRRSGWRGCSRACAKALARGGKGDLLALDQAKQAVRGVATGMSRCASLRPYSSAAMGASASSVLMLWRSTWVIVPTFSTTLASSKLVTRRSTRSSGISRSMTSWITLLSSAR